MKVFYTCSYYGKARYQKYYDYVLKCLESFKVDVISPEVGNYLVDLAKPEQQNDKKFKNKKELHYRSIRESIDRSDACVFELSFQDFQLGYEAAYALGKGKKVLCLSLFEDFSDKIIDKNLYGFKYTLDELEGMVGKFLDICDHQLLTERFNMFLSRQELEILEKRSQETGLNKSEYIRRLIAKG